ncbi:MAG: aldehyde ferredoxin oxidoreductase [Oscillospiraceae bacterium]|nr:aldehyde ferredoxin oxidoreductase [Oscillospiraceae bacterium]
MAKKVFFDKLPSCYAGKILKIDLTNKTTSVIPTEKYANDYVGGRAMANRIYWDEVKDGNVPALSAENTLIYMTGPLAGTGLPYSGRAIMTGISAKNIPEQYTHSSCGGYFGAVLKWAGYDGFVLTGKADSLTYVVIDDDKISFEDASDLKGMYVIDTQEKLFDKYGRKSSALVIGPAGENLCRHASIVTHADSAFAMPGYGAVWGYKNLKAVVARGTGTVAPMDLEKTLEIHAWRDTPEKGRPYPPEYSETVKLGDFEGASEPHYKTFNSCNPGCNHICMISRSCVTNPLNPAGDKVTMVGKCMDLYGSIMRTDNDYPKGSYIDFPRQSEPGKYLWQVPILCDEEDPLKDEYLDIYPGNLLNMWGPNAEFGDMMMWCCNQYGLDKWDIAFWLFTWIYQCQLEGLFQEEGIDFGRPIDFNDPQFTKHILESMTYRTGPMGDLLAEGVGRMIRALGKEKFGDTIRHGITNRDGEERLTPVSWETSWGECSHWQGRGFQGCEKHVWVSMNILHMIGSRDEANGAHSHDHYENYLQYKDDPCHHPLMVEAAVCNIRRNEMKDSLLLCEYKDPDPGRPNMELDMYKAALGVKDITLDDIDHLADRGKIIERAIFMRDHGRTRDMEVAQVYPWMTFPDPWGDTVTWDEWNDLVDLFYKNRKWDLETGWPTREAWEEVELDDIAEFFAEQGKIPTANPDYVRKPDPFGK